jgi:xylulokinase
MGSELLLGVDVGTSATKALVCDASGRVVATASAGHPTSQPRPGWSEQDPCDWWKSSIAAIRAAIGHPRAAGGHIVAVGLSGQMHGSVFLSGVVGDVEPLRPALLWNDQRTGAQCSEIESAFGGRSKLVELVGNAALTGFTLPKILWVREHEPEVFARVGRVLLPKDYIRLRLTGEFATDVGDASGTLLLDVGRRQWSERASELAGLDAGILPRVVESGAVTGRVTREAAAETGLREGTVVVGGSGDNQAGAIGAGVVKPGMVLATLGTSGVIYAHAERPRKDLSGGGRVHTMCAANGTASKPGAWSITGCMLSAGGSLQWCRDALWPGVGFDELMTEAASVRPGSDGLVFLPYLTGERCPHPDPSARGGWVGLTSRHTRGHLVRAVLEGVTFGMGQILDLVRGLGIPVDRVRLGGGGARSDLWRRMQADVYGCPVAMTDTEEGPAFGAALLAGVGAGVFADVEKACELAIHETAVFAPDDDAAARYTPAIKIYGELYGDLKARFAELLASEQG